MVYNPAYCPRLLELLLEIQKEFKNGIDRISPMVTTIIAQMASPFPPGKTLYSKKAKLTSVTPKEMYERFDLFPSNWYTRTISMNVMINPFNAIRKPMNCSLNCNCCLKKTGRLVNIWKKHIAKKVVNKINSK